MPGLRSRAVCWVAESPREAVVIVLLRGDRILMIQRAPGVPRAGTWSPPTGRIEPGESPQQAVVREAREELGVRVTPRRQVWTSLTDDGRYRLHWWQVACTEPAFRPDPAEVAELRWIRADEFDTTTPHFEQHRAFFTGVLPQLFTDSRDHP